MRRVSQAGLVALLAAALLALPARAAVADEVTGGWLDWGVRSSFLEYVTGPIAQGNWELTDGAAARGADRFRFHSGAGSYHPDRGEYRATYSGAVRFLGHAHEDGTYELDLTIANPTVEIAGGGGTLYADVTSEAGRHDQVPFADLAIADVEVDGAGTAAASRVAATLTARGAEAFAGFYAEGEQLDPIDFTGEVAVAATPEPEPSPEPASPEPASAAPPEPTRSASPAPPPATAAAQEAGSGSALLPISLGAAAIAGAAVLTGVVWRRRRAATGPPEDSTQD